jgi:GT2 family glycosyltransferase
MNVSVVICAHDERRWSTLCEAMRSLSHQSVPPERIILVTDHNRALFDRARAEFAKALVVESDENPGLGGARTAGAKRAETSIVAFLDDDAVASPSWLEVLGRGYDRPEVAGVGGPVVPHWLDGRPSWFPEEFDWVVGCSYRGMPEHDATVRNLIGCNMSFRRELLEELGYFRVGCYGDETELCIRLHQRWPELELRYVPAAAVRHTVDGSKTTMSRFVSRCFFEGGSKAVITELLGTADGLSSERAYTRTVLPAAVVRGLGATARGDLSGFARAAAVSLGLAITAAGYVNGKIFIEGTARERGWQGPALRERRRTFVRNGRP